MCLVQSTLRYILRKSSLTLRLPICLSSVCFSCLWHALRKSPGTITICYTFLSDEVTGRSRGNAENGDDWISVSTFVFSMPFGRVNFPWKVTSPPFRVDKHDVSGVSVRWHYKCREWRIAFCLGMLPKQQRNVMRAVGSHRSSFYEQTSQRPESLFLSVSAVTLRKSERAVNHLGRSVFWSSTLPIASVIL